MPTAGLKGTKGKHPTTSFVSALQKEIRRGFHERAFYWAVAMAKNAYGKPSPSQNEE